MKPYDAIFTLLMFRISSSIRILLSRYLKFLFLKKRVNFKSLSGFPTPFELCLKSIVFGTLAASKMHSIKLEDWNGLVFLHYSSYMFFHFNKDHVGDICCLQFFISL
ncbi:hypothetical protein CICLE_v10013917mg [Citrus x clementina]|uniref:Uncharacterized protein n=1 Tax=Citrus clementina TaxID=85681 RepID=V4UQU1_CITCL|nr:hypothetical protein CICLE_v10013917mg [Citrus x clementina]